MVRVGNKSDLRTLLKIDTFVAGDNSRQNFNHKSLRKWECLLALVDNNLRATWGSTSFLRSNVRLAALHRRGILQKEVGTALIGRIELSCNTRKIFTSTNQSNVRMQSLLEKLRYERSGYFENLDEGNRKTICFKCTWTQLPKDWLCPINERALCLLLWAPLRWAWFSYTAYSSLPMRSAFAFDPCEVFLPRRFISIYVCYVWGFRRVLQKALYEVQEFP